MRQRGFTLVEFILTAAIVGILGAVAVRAYQQSLERASFAQQLVDIGHIRRVVEIEGRGGTRDLLAGSRPGRAPTALAGQLPDSEFDDGRGLRFQLVHLPMGALRAPDTHASYGLVAEISGSPERIWLFQKEIERAGFESAWLSERSFVFAIANFVDPPGAPTTQPPAATPPPAVSSPPAVTPPPPVTPPPAVSPPPAVTPPPAAPSPPADTAAGCGPGQEAIGQSGKCRPVADAGKCPPGSHPAGSSGNCKPEGKTGAGR